MHARNLQEAIAEVQRIDQESLAAGLEPIDPKIRDLVIGLRRWGFETLGSCQGHLDALAYPYVHLALGSDFNLLVKLILAWAYPDIWKNSPWVLKPFATMWRLMPQDISPGKLKENQKVVQRFGRFLQKLPQDHFAKAPSQ